jgi:hypothetical protein
MAGVQRNGWAGALRIEFIEVSRPRDLAGQLLLLVLN